MCSLAPNVENRVKSLANLRVTSVCCSIKHGDLRHHLPRGCPHGPRRATGASMAVICPDCAAERGRARAARALRRGAPPRLAAPLPQLHGKPDRGGAQRGRPLLRDRTAAAGDTAAAGKAPAGADAHGPRVVGLEQGASPSARRTPTRINHHAPSAGPAPNRASSPARQN